MKKLGTIIFSLIQVTGFGQKNISSVTNQRDLFLQTRISELITDRVFLVGVKFH